MTRYLIIALVIAIFLLSIIVLASRFFSQGKSQASPLPIQTAPSKPPTPPASSSPKKDIAPPDQMKIQSEADQDFAEKTKQMNDAYPWLNKLPIQAQNYYVYFDVDVDQKQFIAKLYPNSSSATPVDQQIEAMKREIESKLKSSIPDYNNYQIKWDIKVE